MDIKPIRITRPDDLPGGAPRNEKLPYERASLPAAGQAIIRGEQLKWTKAP